MNGFRMHASKQSSDDTNNNYTIGFNQPSSSSASFRQNYYQPKYTSPSPYTMHTTQNDIHNIQMRLLEARNKNIAMKKTLVQTIQNNIINTDNNKMINRDIDNSYSNVPSKKVTIQESIKNDDDSYTSKRGRRGGPSAKGNKEDNPISPEQYSRKFMEKPQDIDSDDSDLDSPVPPHKVPPRSSRRNTPQPKTPQNDPKLADLAIIAEQMSRAINDNQAVLAPIGEIDVIKKEKMLSKEAEKKRYKDVLESINENYEIMPLWRHRMKGRFNPPPSLILKGKRLFKIVAWGIIIFYARPYTIVMRERKKNRDRHTVELKKNITMFADGCDDWLGQLNRVTISSVENDISLDFEPADSFVNNRNMPLKQRTLQLKIRVKAVIDAITSSELPTHFVDLMVTMIDDGNYFFKEFLFDYESKLLDFDPLGGTRNMLTLPSSNYNYNGQPKVLFEIGLSKARIDALKGRTIIQNFILIKILIGHILLAPWNFGVAKKPMSNIKRLVNNHRVLATVLYEILRLVDPEVPFVDQSNIQNTDEKQQDYNEEKKPANEVENGDKDDKVDEGYKVEPPQNDASKENKKFESDEDSGLEKFLGVLLGRTKKSKEIASNSIEERLIGHKTPFVSLQEIHNLLLPAKAFDDIRKDSMGWMQEYANKLDVWINTVVNTVLNRRHTLIRQDLGGEDNAENMLGSLTARRITSRVVVPKLELANLLISSSRP